MGNLFDPNVPMKEMVKRLGILMCVLFLLKLIVGF